MLARSRESIQCRRRAVAQAAVRLLREQTPGTGIGP